MDSTPTSPPFPTPPNNLNREALESFIIFHADIDSDPAKSGLVTQAVMNAFGPCSESLTGTYLIAEEFCIAKPISHQGSIATMLQVPATFGAIFTTDGYDKMNIVYEHRMYKNIRLIPHTSSVVVDHTRTTESTLGGNILFPIHVVNSQDELEVIITNFFKRTGYCTIAKFGPNMRRITDRYGVPTGRQLYFEIVFTEPHNPATFRLKVNEFSFIKIGIHNIKIKWFTTLVRSMELCDCCFIPYMSATCVRSAQIRRNGYDKKARAGPSTDRADTRAAATRQRTAGVRRSYAQFSRD